MSRLLLTLLCVLVLSACGGPASPPENLDNACLIFKERPHYYRAMKAAERKWGAPIAVQMAIIHQESRFVKNAKTKRTYFLGIIPTGRISSAYGYSQAIDGTWQDYLDDHGTFNSRRTDIRHATDFIGWYLRHSNKSLGISMSDTKRQYLAYHEGRAGYKRGSYLKKAWLLKVSDKVAQRAKLYARQLNSCGY